MRGKKRQRKKKRKEKKREREREREGERGTDRQTATDSDRERSYKSMKTSSHDCPQGTYSLRYVLGQTKTTMDWAIDG